MQKSCSFNQHRTAGLGSQFGRASRFGFPKGAKSDLLFVGSCSPKCFCIVFKEGKVAFFCPRIQIGKQDQLGEISDENTFEQPPVTVSFTFQYASICQCIQGVICSLDGIVQYDFSPVILYSSTADPRKVP